jgi:hypothetical protein
MLPVPRIKLPARHRKAAREVGDVLECGDGAERIRRFRAGGEMVRWMKVRLVFESGRGLSPTAALQNAGAPEHRHPRPPFAVDCESYLEASILPSPMRSRTKKSTILLTDPFGKLPHRLPENLPGSPACAPCSN